MTKLLKREYLLLGFILAVGCALRFAGVEFGLPQLYHADEPIVVNHALAYGTWDFNPHFFRIPPLVSYLLFALYGLFFVVGSVLGAFESIADFEALFYSDPSSFYILARIIFGVLLGTHTIYALYRVIRQNFSWQEGLFAAALLALCFLHIRDSHYIYTDIPLVFVLVWAAGCFFRHLCGHNLWRDHLLSGVMIGLATATKYNGAVIAVVYVVCALQRGSAAERVSKLGIAGFGALVTYCCLNPFSILDFAYFMQEASGEASAHGGVAWGLHLFRSLLGGVGLPLFLLGFLGMFQRKTFEDPKRLSLALFLIVYYIVLVCFGQPYERYVLPLLPFFLFFAVEGFIVVAGKFRLNILYCGVLFILCVSIPLMKAVKWNALMGAADVRTLASDWVEANVPEGSKIAFDVSAYMPRLALTADALNARKQRLIQSGAVDDPRIRKLTALMEPVSGLKRYQLFQLTNHPETRSQFLLEKSPVPYDISLLRDAGIEYVIVSPVHEKGIRSEFYKQLKMQARRLKTFSPYRDRAILYPYQAVLTGGPFLWVDIMKRERNGQPLKIYKI